MRKKHSLFLVCPGDATSEQDKTKILLMGLRRSGKSSIQEDTIQYLCIKSFALILLISVMASTVFVLSFFPKNKKGSIFSIFETNHLTCYLLLVTCRLVFVEVAWCVFISVNAIS